MSTAQAAAAAPMQALAIAMVKNEADIIEAFARHALHFVDLLVVIENRSTDGTREILQALRREGLNILLVDDPVFGYFQAEKVTDVYRRVVPVFQPEIVYLLDADEFISAPDRATLEAELATLPPGGVGLLPWRTYLPKPGADADAVLHDPLGTLTRRRRREEPTYVKAVIRRRAADDQQLVIEQGSHGVRRSDGQPVPAQPLRSAALAHLPVRSVDQLTAKVVNGWHAYVVRNRVRRVAGQGYHWQDLYNRILQTQGLVDADLVEVALGYAQQPRPDRSLAADSVEDPVTARYGALRYGALGCHSAIAKVARSVEGFLLDPSIAAPASDGTAMDLAPVADFVQQWQSSRIATTPAGRPWVAELKALDARIGPAEDGLADLLLAPQLPLSDSMGLAQAFAGQAKVPVIFWPDRPRRADELREELAAWAAAGYEPQLLQSLSLRALASYAALRNGALVLRPRPPVDAPVADPAAAVVREAFCQFASAPQAWNDPSPQCIRHPLQSLQLAA